MRNLKLKQVLPVDTESETLQKFSQASDGRPNASSAVGADAATARVLHSVKETPRLHVMGDLYDVQCDADFMVNADRLRAHCLKLVEDAGLTSVGDFFHQFDGGGGVTGMVVLAESHMSVHTWPEKGYAACDVFTCGPQTLPEAACMALVRAFESPRYFMRRFPRGEQLAAPVLQLRTGSDPR